MNMTQPLGRELGTTYIGETGQENTPRTRHITQQHPEQMGSRRSRASAVVAVPAGPPAGRGGGSRRRDCEGPNFDDI